jgi:hypothetical protein
LRRRRRRLAPQQVQEDQQVEAVPQGQEEPQGRRVPDHPMELYLLIQVMCLRDGSRPAKNL